MKRQPKVYAEDPAYPAGTARQGVRTRVWLAGRIAPVLVADATRRGVTDPAERREVMREAAAWADALVDALNEVHR